MSKYLAVDTSSRYLTALAVNDGKTYCHYDGACALNHSVKLMGAVEEALANADLTVGDCDFFVAVVGPGSFTGIRIGIATAKGFAVATGKQLLAITSFDVVAYNVADEHFMAVIDAGHGYYYTCEYTQNNGVLTAQQGIYTAQSDLIATGLPLYGFEDLALPRYTQVSAEQGLQKAIEGKKDLLSDTIEALYVRKSQAEEGRK